MEPPEILQPSLPSNAIWNEARAVVPNPLVSPGLHNDPHRLFGNKDVPPGDASRSRRQTLADFAKEFFLFTHGLFMSRAMFRKDPLVDFVAMTEAAVTVIAADRPFFTGFVGTDAISHWDYQIFAVGRQFESQLVANLSCAVGVDYDRCELVRTVPQVVPVLDLLAMDGLSLLPDRLPYVDVMCFALLGNKKSYHFDPRRKKSLLDPVPVVADRADDETILLANSMFGKDA